MATRRHRYIPKSFEELVEHYDHYITVIIRRVSRGAVREDDLHDLKQAVYTRLWETHYLDRYTPDRGSFSNYLYVLVRSVVANVFDKNSRNPLNMAYGVTERAPHDSARVEGDGARMVADEGAARLVLERHKDARDEAWEDRQVAQDLLTRLAAFAATSKTPVETAAVLRLLHEGYTPGEIASQLGRSPSMVARCRRDLKQALRERLQARAS